MANWQETVNKTFYAHRGDITSYLESQAKVSFKAGAASRDAEVAELTRKGELLAQKYGEVLIKHHEEKEAAKQEGRREVVELVSKLLNASGHLDWHTYERQLKEWNL